MRYLLAFFNTPAYGAGRFSVMKTKSFRINQDLNSRLERLAEFYRIEPSDVIRMSIDWYVNKVEKEGLPPPSFGPKDKKHAA